MRSRISLVASAFVVIAAAFALLLVGLSQASAVEKGAAAHEEAAQTDPGDDGPGIQATELISIPYGFEIAQTLPGAIDPVVVSGIGACTAGEEITIFFTVTQSSTGATATGEWNGDCTGEVQTWTGEGALATPSPNFSGGLAEGCATAETRDGESVTDTQDWCDPLILTNEELATVFLPVALAP